MRDVLRRCAYLSTVAFTLAAVWVAVLVLGSGWLRVRLTPDMRMTLYAPALAATYLSIVVYCRFRKAIAPSKMVPAMACISGVPVSLLNTSRAR